MKFWKNIKSKKTLLVGGTILGIVASSVCTFAAVQLCWLTPAERDAARTALTTVDGLRDVALVNGDDADQSLRQAEDQVESARQAARTMRDQDVAFALMQYLSSIELERGAMRMQGIAPEQVEPPGGRNLQLAGSAPLTETASIHSMRLKLHKTLD